MSEHMTITHNHEYVCEDAKTGAILSCEKLPPILKALREETDYTFKIPHGNKVRTMILEDGVCNICDPNTYELLYVITVNRW